MSIQWTNVGNWVARAAPGALNQTGNTVSGDIATFTSPIPVSGIGSAAQPIAPDDATVAAARSRCVSGITFDSNSCGAYVIQSPSPAVFAAAGVPQTGILVVSHNGAIRINPAVTNSQLLLIPMQVLMPSSIAGIFNIVNNSTNPAAALTISSIIHGGATTRATTFILGGTNAGPNSITNLLEGVGNATGGFTKQDPGTWILNGVNDFKAGSPLNINKGTLVVKNGGEFGNVTTTATVTSNAVLQIDGINLGLATLVLNLAQNATIRMNGSATVNGIAVTTAASASPTLATTSFSDLMTVGNAAPKLIGGAADTVLHVTGPGTVSLAFDASYVGRWSVDAGTLSLLTSLGLGTGANLNIAAGGTFDVTARGAGGYTLTTAALSASGTGIAVGATAATIRAAGGATVDLVTGAKPISLTYSPMSFTGDLLHPALYLSQGILSLGGNSFNVNNASGTPLGAGTYRLIQQASGNVTDGGGYSVAVTGSGLAFGYAAALEVAGGNVNLTVSAVTNCCDTCTTNNIVSRTNLITPGYNFLAINLCHGTSNTVNDLLIPLQGDAASTQLSFLKWNFLAQSYEPALTYYGPTDAGTPTGGWYDDIGNPSSTTLAPGEGFVIQNTSGATFSYVEQGCPPACPPPCLPTNGCSLVGRFGIGTTMWTDLSSCPPLCGTRFSIWSTNAFLNYDYVNGTWLPNAPVLGIGKSAFVCVLANSNCACLGLSNELLTAATNAPGTFNYSFTLQNNTTVPVKYLFLVPATNCYTITPDIFVFKPLLQPGQTTNLGAVITQTGNCGTNLCLLLSLHDSNLVNCCSRELCLRIATNAPTVQCPDPVTVCGPTNGVSVTLTAQSSDPATTQWRVDGTLVQSGGLTLTRNFPLGTHTVTVTIPNGLAAPVSCTTTVTVLLQPQMSIQFLNGQVVVSWSGGGVLQSATDLTGLWTDVPGATSPYSIPPAGAHKFYRVRCP